MDNTKYTKGEWKVFTNAHKECNGDEWGWVGLNTFNSKSINKCSVHWSGNEAKANALLISKAPEMLEELIKEVEILKSMGLGDTDRCKRKEQLIKSATEI